MLVYVPNAGGLFTARCLLLLTFLVLRPRLSVCMILISFMQCFRFAMAGNCFRSWKVVAPWMNASAAIGSPKCSPGCPTYRVDTFVTATCPWRMYCSMAISPR